MLTKQFWPSFHGLCRIKAIAKLLGRDDQFSIIIPDLFVCKLFVSKIA